MCQIDVEVLDHILLLFPLARELWFGQFGKMGIQWVLPIDYKSFCVGDFFSGAGLKRKVDMLWEYDIADVIWVIWMERNRRISLGFFYLRSSNLFLWFFRNWESSFFDVLFLFEIFAFVFIFFLLSGDFFLMCVVDCWSIIFLFSIPKKK